MDNKRSRSSIIGVSAKYWIAGGSHDEERPHPQQNPTISRTFDASNTSHESVRVGLPEGSKPVKPQPGDDTYSGMHDQGPLPELKEGGTTAVLLGCVKAAKEFNDHFLTERIQEENKHKQSEMEAKTQVPSKRSKTEKS
mmetsp:Transcript_607/g.963  ORF Transcript_607/g.963 Transcript_607/m.963 type:complete len:139 (+) Transcript_607:44-460(+)